MNIFFTYKQAQKGKEQCLRNASDLEIESTRMKTTRLSADDEEAKKKEMTCLTGQG